MNKYTIPENFIAGKTYVIIDTMDELHDFIASCAAAGLNTNINSTKAFYQKCYKPDRYFYLRYDKPLGYRSIIVNGSISVVRHTQSIPASDLLIDSSETYESILELL